MTNTGDDDVKAVVTVTGAPLTPEPAAEKGFKIERQTYTLDGDPVDPTQVKQNTRIVVVLKITEAQPQFGRVIVADYLPAGFEIDNPHLVSSGDTGTLSWITDAREPVNTEFRDDRFTAAFERKKDDRRGVHRRLCGARGRARQICAAAGERRGHVPPRPLRPHRDRKRRSHGGEMTRRLLTTAGASRIVAAMRWRCRSLAFGAAAAVVDRRRSVRRRSARISHSRRACVDRDGRLLRAYATSEGRWRLPATVADVDPRFLRRAVRL